MLFFFPLSSISQIKREILYLGNAVIGEGLPYLKCFIMKLLCAVSINNMADHGSLQGFYI